MVEHCRRCGRKITLLESIRRGYGGTCYAKITKSIEDSNQKPLVDVFGKTQKE